MSDKQEINVTKCIHFDKSDVPNGCTCYWDGECNHDCYYKQLKRKEQECEKLKLTLAETKEITIGMMDDNLDESSAYYDAKQILQKISEVLNDRQKQ